MYLNKCRIHYWKVKNKFSKKGLGQFFWKMYFLTLKIYSLRPTIAHLLRIVKFVWPLAEWCDNALGVCPMIMIGKLHKWNTNELAISSLFSIFWPKFYLHAELPLFTGRKNIINIEFLNKRAKNAGWWGVWTRFAREKRDYILHIGIWLSRAT